METLIHADIFFFVTTVVLIVFSIGVIIALIYVIKILHNVFHVSVKVKEESDEILSDIKTLRGNVKSHGFSVKYIKAFISKVFKRKKK
jgi:hypothetical protein